jgi:Skp family chaperone for outer membrane proteins
MKMLAGPRMLVCLLFAVAAAAMPAAAQEQPTKVAVADPARIFTEMQETRDLKVRLDAERNDLGVEEKARRQKIEDLQATRNLLKPDSQQYAEANKQLNAAMIEFKVWAETMQQEIQRNQKQQMRQLFDKITIAAGEVAKQRGFDIVIADQRPEVNNLDQLNVNQLRDLINQRNVLYADPKTDITDDVIKALDAKHKAGGGSGAAPAPPAPADAQP